LLSQGTIVSGYRVDGVLGEGGMGVVYRATQLSLNRTVALKILATELSQDGAFRERFRREGLLQAAIDHEHIVTVYEAGDTEHGLFLAMRLIRGPTLKDMILAGELDAERTLRILTQVAQALETAHDVGLTHRDIKPQNILIGANDHAYLADFGLTQASDEVSLTETGQFIGTIDYVAPEQIQGQGATAQSDVYSLTAVLYEAMTREVPFVRQNEAAVLYAHIAEPPPRVTERRSDMPSEIDAVVARGMAKLPADRYESAGELVREAKAAFGDEAAAATTLRPQAPPPTARPPETLPAGKQTRARDTQPTPAGAPAAATTLPAEVTAGAANASTATRAAVPAPAPPAAAPTTAAAPPAAAPPAARGRGLTGGGIALVAVLGLAGAAGGYLLGSGGNDADRAAEPFGNSASAGTLQLSFPAAWKRVSDQPQVPGVRFKEPIVLAAGKPQGARLVAGQVAGRGPELLSAGLARRLPSGSPDAQPVRLGGVQALRYRGLAPRGLTGALQLYAVPTTRGVATIACTGPAGTAGAAFRRDCESVATTLRLVGAEPYPLGPRPEYARSLRRTLGALDQARRSGTARLAGADTPDAQAAAAATLAGSYRRASEAVAATEASPADAAANRSLAAALERTGSAYGAAAEAARANDEAAYADAASAVSKAQSAVRRALDGFKQLGYVFS
jgi:predicted Ser/Thr protein kinase